MSSKRTESRLAPRERVGHVRGSGPGDKPRRHGGHGGHLYNEYLRDLRVSVVRKAERSAWLDFETDVDGRCRMCEGANRHIVGAGRGKFADALERHAAGNLRSRAPAAT